MFYLFAKKSINSAENRPLCTRSLCFFSCSTLLPKPVEGSPEGPLEIFYDQFTRILLMSIDSV